ncbi:MAG: discoidin domain-containing protein [Saprospiraceae bacterium]|nr:discoidin domain-containing protein [Saprospiraceae bacterium]
MRVFIFLILTAFSCELIVGQQQFTKYDEVPGNIKSYKPHFQNEYPYWAKQMYAEEVNFFDVMESFDKWEAQNTGEFRPIRRYFKNWSKHVLPYVAEDGTISLPSPQDYVTNLLKVQKQQKTTSQERNGSDWSFLGPKETFWLNESGAQLPPPAAPWQVNIYSFDVAKTNEDVLYCGTETGYMNKTVDKGSTWQQLGLDYNFGGGITAVRIDPENENVVYASGGAQMHKTEDGGMTWTPLLGASGNFPSDRLEIDKSNSNKIYSAGNNGIHISEDGGVNWQRTLLSKSYDVHRHPTLENVVYGLTKVGSFFRVMISEDGGSTFMESANFPTNVSDASGGLIAVSEDDANSIYVICLTSNNTPQIYKGDYLTGDWDILSVGNTNSLGLNNGQGYFDLVFEVSDQDARIIYAGTSSLYISRNGGNTFSLIGGYGGNFPIHPDIQDMKILDDGEVWVSTDGGMNYSSDNFSFTDNHQAKINGIIGSDMWGFDQGWNEDIIVGGRYHNGNTSIADFYGSKALRMGGAESPTGWILKGKSRHVAFNDLGAGWILPRTAEGQPEGRFLFSKYPNMDEYGGRRGNIATHPNYSGTLFLGEGNVLWKSEDSGMSYDMMYDFGAKVRYLDVSYSNPNVMYADVVGRGLYKSEDGGVSWERKNALTTAPNGNSSWGGRLYFAISPTNENAIYACLQNGTWSSDIGRVFKSVDGGDSWQDWTGQLSEYTKNLVVQPDANGHDVVYLFTNARDKKAKVFVRMEDGDNWDEFSNGFPAGFQVNQALPFYRDGKLRVAGNSGIWESPLMVHDYEPILNPWVEKSVYPCVLDSVYFEDHSIINHEGCSWKWEITPEPVYMSDASARNPVVVLGNVGSYDVKMTITKNGVDYSKTMIGLISATSCPSIEDCSNPDQLPKDIWSLVSVDSEETIYPGLARMAFDDDAATIWHTRWTSGNDDYPHEMVVDMGDVYLANSFTYLPRQNGTNGRVKDYELYVSNEPNEWGEAVSFGQFDNSFAPSVVPFSEAVEGRYFKLVCLSEVNGNIWASAAEFSIQGCYANSLSNINVTVEDAQVFPVPTDGVFTLSLPKGSPYSYIMYSANGKIVNEGQLVGNGDGYYRFNLNKEDSGIYIIVAQNENGQVFRSKVIVLK